MARKQPTNGQRVNHDGRNYTYRHGSYYDDSGIEVFDRSLIEALADAFTSADSDNDSGSSSGGNDSSGDSDSGGSDGGGD